MYISSASLLISPIIFLFLDVWNVMKARPDEQLTLCTAGKLRQQEIGYVENKCIQFLSTKIFSSFGSVRGVLTH